MKPTNAIVISVGIICATFLFVNNQACAGVAIMFVISGVPIYYKQSTSSNKVEDKAGDK